MDKVSKKKVKIKTGEFLKPFQWTLKPTGFNNQFSIGYMDQFSEKSAKIFSNGTIHVCGCVAFSDTV